MPDGTKRPITAEAMGTPAAHWKRRTAVISIILGLMAAVVWVGHRPLYMLQSGSYPELLCNAYDCYLFIDFADFGDSGSYGAAAGKLLCAALGGRTPWSHKRSGTIMYHISRSEIVRYEVPVGYVGVYGNTLYAAAGSMKWNGGGFEEVTREERKQFETATDRPTTLTFSDYNGWSMPGVGGGSEDSPWSYTVELDGQSTTFLARASNGVSIIEVQRGKNPPQALWTTNRNFHQVSHQEFVSTFDTAFDIRISTPQPTVRPGSDVRLLVTRTNISDRDAIIDVVDSEGWERLTFDLEIRDSAFNQPPETVYGRKTERRETSETRWKLLQDGEDHIVKPGEKFEQEILLNKLFDFSKPGKYVVQLEWMDPKSKVLLTSNGLLVTVSP